MCSEVPKIRAMMMPKDTNPHGIIFGGVLLSYIDQAGAIMAREHAMVVATGQVSGGAKQAVGRMASGVKFVTVAMDGICFHEPVFVGDIISLCAEVVRTGKSSIVVKVTVTADRFDDLTRAVKVTDSIVTYVAVDENRRPFQVFLSDDDG